MYYVTKLSARRVAAFTLVELLVSTALLSLLMVMTTQVVSHTMSATTASNKSMDTSSMARIILDRFSNDFASGSFNYGSTALYYSGSGGLAIDENKDSAISFICKSRARSEYAANAAAVSGRIKDVRGLLVGYKIRDLAGKTTTIPLIARGDATFTFSEDYSGKSQSANKYNYNINRIFGTGDPDYSIPKDLSLTDTSKDQTFLNWQGLGDGVLKFHISFVLDDGTIVQIPPSQNGATVINFPVSGTTGDCIPVAFTSESSADPNKRFVRGLIVGIAVVDEETLRLAYLAKAKYADTLSTQLKRPAKVGQTPVEIWQANLSEITFGPVQKNIRFYQRFIPVNL